MNACSHLNRVQRHEFQTIQCGDGTWKTGDTINQAAAEGRAILAMKLGKKLLRASSKAFHLIDYSVVGILLKNLIKHLLEEKDASAQKHGTTKNQQKGAVYVCGLFAYTCL